MYTKHTLRVQRVNKIIHIPQSTSIQGHPKEERPHKLGFQPLNIQL